ncbi:hypothetical protein AOPFMNJM_1003 [Methylobacterium jeotgali]|uniref:Murein endopeptidase K n=4 Tax=Pseudomonadota TaxID=1224 RepID=A0ABQ4SRH2_9HYPH|nr:hypothetical protein AOPFMNJM_1003 [Methylobacterium jeotgali]
MTAALADGPDRRRGSETAGRLRAGLKILALGGLALTAWLGAARGTQDAVANGDTRTLTIFHTHSKESATITFRRDGRYDRAGLDQLNHLLRDWRTDESTRMDPRLFDTVWEVYRQVGSSEAIHIVSAYRAPGTNAMLRRRSKAVAEFSQHMLGKAMDFYLPDVSIDQIRAMGMKLQRGGVGWYPRSGSPFVHLDVGSVRSWPRMTHDQLARLFPDGKTVHLPTDNRPLARYEEARAEVLSRGGTVSGVTQVASAEEEDGPSIRGFFAGLFGGRSETPPAEAAPAPRRKAPAVVVASADPEAGIGAPQALAFAPADPTKRDARALLTAERPAEAAARIAVETPNVDALAAAPAAPLPPRRPAEFAAVMAALTMPLPPARPAQFATLGPTPLPAAVTGMASTLAGTAIDPASRRRAPLVAADADSRTQLRALFEAASAEARPAGPATPVRVAVARPRFDAAPGALVTGAGPRVTTRFAAGSPGDELATSRFTGSATRAVPGAR